MNKFLKNFVYISVVVLMLAAITLVNQVFIKRYQNGYGYIYTNELSKKVTENDLANVDYDYLLKDLNDIDDILKEQVSLEIEKTKKTKYYDIAQEIYSQKINELVRVLNDKLDDEDFYRLESDLDEFQKNIDIAISDLQNTLDSNIELEFYKNKYLYEEKQKKCRDILEMYKGFLK